MQQRIRLKCTACRRHYLVSYTPLPLKSPYLCSLCQKPPQLAGQMILIEVQEHWHLLQLYQANFAEMEFPDPHNTEKRIAALTACNLFFSGD